MDYGVIPISDHDLVYVTVNATTVRFETRYKYIRCYRNFNEHQFVEDFEQLPLNLVYAVSCPDEKLSLFNDLVLSCIEEHAPTKKISDQATSPLATQYRLCQIQTR